MAKWWHSGSCVCVSLPAEGECLIKRSVYETELGLTKGFTCRRVTRLLGELTDTLLVTVRLGCLCRVSSLVPTQLRLFLRHKVRNECSSLAPLSSTPPPEGGLVVKQFLFRSPLYFSCDFFVFCPRRGGEPCRFYPELCQVLTTALLFPPVEADLPHSPEILF